MKAFSSDPRIGFYALANKYSEAASAGTVLAPAKSIAEMERVAFNNYICGTLTVLFVVLVLVMFDPPVSSQLFTLYTDGKGRNRHSRATSFLFSAS